MEKKRRKIVKGKVENWKSKGWKDWKWVWKWEWVKMRREDLFFFFFFFFLLFTFLKTTKICFGATKMEIFYREKIWKNVFAPTEKFSCYAPEMTWWILVCKKLGERYKYTGMIQVGLYDFQIGSMKKNIEAKLCEMHIGLWSEVMREKMQRTRKPQSSFWVPANVLLFTYYLSCL